MKYSRMIPIWQRKRLWSDFINVPLEFRKYLYGNRFEQYCYSHIKRLK